MSRSFAIFLLWSLLATPAPALAEDECHAIEFRFKPGAKDMQIAVWVEDAQGKVVHTPYITRLTGQFGLGNRPGAALLKTNYRWPYGRREMVLPIWAFHRDVHYPKVVMGGICGNSPQSLCPDGKPCGGECEDSTIAYHSRVSSTEPFYCSPNGAGVDALSCASKGTFSKGAYATGTYSLYPPRADLTTMNNQVDSPDLLDFAARNDLVAVSAATPAAGQLLNPPVVWRPDNLPTGDYVAWIELSQEYDFNSGHNHPNQNDSVSAWNYVGKPFLGQPSVVYRVPFHYPDGPPQIATQYAGYSTWNGTDGVLHAPDSTITTDRAGSGAGRLMDVTDESDVYRFKVSNTACTNSPDGGINSGCVAPDPISDLTVTPTATSLKVSFHVPASGATADRYSIRYREGTTAISGATFDAQVAGPMLAGATPGALLEAEITGLQVATSYAVAVRGSANCGSNAAAVSTVSKTGTPKYATIEGCFIATAAYGSDREPDVEQLRRFRDQALLPSSAGQLLVASYYTMSPAVAKLVGKYTPLRNGIRNFLGPVAQMTSLFTNQKAAQNNSEPANQPAAKHGH